MERLFREIGSRHSRSPWTVERARGPRRLGTSRSSAAVNIDRRHFRVQRDQRGALPPEPPRTKQRILKERVLLSLGGSSSPLPVYFPVEPFLFDFLLELRCSEEQTVSFLNILEEWAQIAVPISSIH